MCSLLYIVTDYVSIFLSYAGSMFMCYIRILIDFEKQFTSCRLRKLDAHSSKNPIWRANSPRTRDSRTKIPLKSNFTVVIILPRGT